MSEEAAAINNLFKDADTAAKTVKDITTLYARLKLAAESEQEALFIQFVFECGTEAALDRFKKLRAQEHANDVVDNWVCDDDLDSEPSE